ncbi:MAG: universal stress protein [Desulfobacterales bacterium]|nr:universal stress protein [Desulfobacterales bacterium]
MTKLVCECPLTRGERILVAVDGSEFSNNAVEQAISLGSICNSEIFIISVVDLFPEQMEVAPSLVEKMSEDARAYIEKAKKKVDEAKLPCETIVRMGGAPYEFIVQEAKEKNIDLIVMGTHGRRGLERIIMGSTAQNVIGHAPCPVIVVPKAS